MPKSQKARRYDLVKIVGTLPHSRADRAGILAGDTLISINGNEIFDVLDYRFYLTEKNITLTLSRNGEEYTKKMRKEEYDDIGLEFETPLMDQKHSCRNKCIFCFIDQLPKGLRETLYFKDDDSRLSFLHGNYITLTNLSDRDIDRIIKMHISPINISVHTTNPELRCKMMHNKRAGEVLSYMKRLADAGCHICGQIVLCRGINDGAELDRSMRDLEELIPSLQSVSIVPAGLTKFRDGLYPLEPYTPEECRAVIAQVDAFAEKCKEKHGTRLFYCGDELYIKGGLPLPADEYYEEYSQIENGVGLVTSLITSVNEELEYADEYQTGEKKRKVSIATGVAAYDYIRSIADRLSAVFAGLEVNVYRIENRFFGENITVAGLLTGKDVSEQLAGKDLGDELLIPAVTLRSEGDLFLCGMSHEELAKILNVKITPVGNDGIELIKAVLGQK